MIINNNVQSIMQLYGVNNSQQLAKTNITGTNKTSADEVVLSETAQSFAQVLQKAQKSMNEVRMDKVDALSQQIADGTYQVNARAIADKMLQGFY